MRRSETDWQLGAVLKDKPGSQGTLFRAGTAYSSDARFPRKHTPERLAEVKEAMGTSQYNIGGPPMGGMMGQGTRPERRQMISNIARSTVPVEHLHGVKFYPGQNNLDHDSGIENDPTHTAGLYQRQERPPAFSGDHSTYERQVAEWKQKNPAKISILQGEADNSTVIHEIGHHVSHAVAKNAFSAYDTPRTRGMEEGFADDYAAEHYRNKKGQPEGKGVYAMGLRSKRRTDAFYEAYHAHRGTEDLLFMNDDKAKEIDAQRHAAKNEGALFHVRKDGPPNAYYKGMEVNPEVLPSGVRPEQVMTPTEGSHYNPARTPRWAR